MQPSLGSAARGPTWENYIKVAIWMMAAYFDSIPITLEEAAWVEGCSVFSSFTRIVLRNSLPGILSTAIFSFLLAWNDYLVAVVFLQTNCGPVMAVAVCGISGSLAGR